MPKCTTDKGLWEPESIVERRGDSRFQATRASKMRIRIRNECEFHGNTPQRNRSIDEEQGTDNTWAAADWTLRADRNAVLVLMSHVVASDDWTLMDEMGRPLTILFSFLSTSSQRIHETSVNSHNHRQALTLCSVWFLANWTPIVSEEKQEYSTLEFSLLRSSPQPFKAEQSTHWIEI